MERAGDFDRAQRYHKYEVKARIKRPSTLRSERWAARAYEDFSNYGGSLIRPVIWLGIFGGIFAVIYFALACASDLFNPDQLRIGSHLIADALNAFSLSFRNALLNLDSFGGSAVTSHTLSEELFGGGLISGAARVAGALQTLLSLILAFLFGLAVRRKFQIR